MTQTEPHHPLLSILKGFLAGAVTGVVGVVLPYPFESYRLKLLFAPNGSEAGVKVPSLFERKVWAGLSGALMQGVALRGVTFGTYDFVLRHLSSSERGSSSLKDPIWHHAVAGGIASFALAWVREPYGVYRCQTQASTTAETSFTRFVLQNFRRNFGADLYAGFFSSSSIGFASRGVYFSGYEAVKRALHRQYSCDHGAVGEGGSKSFPLWQRIASASVAGPLSLIVVYPFDVVRSKMRAMDRSKVKVPLQYSSFWHCWSVTKSEGALFRGLGIVMVRSAPMASITLPFYESCYLALGRWMGV